MQTVKEDRQRKGLLFAGTELGVYVSFNDGDDWQSLQLNLPPVSMRDLAIHGDDLIVATHGRGFWVLEDITALRQISDKVKESDAFLFQPAAAMRMHAGTDYASPMPRDEALTENPPVGAMIDYYLKSPAPGSLVIEIIDGKGKVVRRYSSDDKASAVKPETLQFPAFWRPAPQRVSTAAGMHRWIWDLHYAEVPGSTRLAGDEFVVAPRGVTALPGTYTVRLTVAGKSYSEPLSIKMDPRIKTSAAELQKQFEAAIEVSRRQSEINEAQRSVKEVLLQARQLRSKASQNAALVPALDAFIQKAEDVAGAPADRFGVLPSKPAKEHEDLESLHSKFAKIFSAINGGDLAPTMEAMQAFGTAQRDLAAVMAKWEAFTSKDLPAVNGQLKQAGLAPIVIGEQGPSPVEEDLDESDTK
jgi:hypothetical protein